MFRKLNIWSSAKLAQWGLMIITLLHLMAKPVKGYMAQVFGWMDLHRSVMVKRDLSVKVRLTIYRSIYVPTLTCGHELWVLAEKMRSQIAAVEMELIPSFGSWALS